MLPLPGLLVVRTPVSRADVIVVLGGDSPRRAGKAAALYNSGAAPRVLVSGTGDCKYIRNYMVEAGVPDSAIDLECVSHSTWENANFSAPILERMGVRSGILVTSWFHSRRALSCFVAVVPQVRWMSAPVERDQLVWDLLTTIDGLNVAKEPFKILWYASQCVPWRIRSYERRGSVDAQSYDSGPTPE